jgi:hypothetical protein
MDILTFSPRKSFFHFYSNNSVCHSDDSFILQTYTAEAQSIMGDNTRSSGGESFRGEKMGTVNLNSTGLLNYTF